MSTAVQRTNTAVARKNETLNPLASLPPAVLEPAGRFLLFFSDLLKDQVGFVARVTYWMDAEGVTEADMVAAFRSMMRPGATSDLDYGGKVLSALGAAVDKAVADRKAEERRAKQRAERGRPVIYGKRPEVPTVADVLKQRATKGGK